MKNLGAQIVPIIQSNVPPLLASYDYECNGSNDDSYEAAYHTLISLSPKKYHRLSE